MTVWKRKVIESYQIVGMVAFQQAERGQTSWADAYGACMQVGLLEEAEYCNHMMMALMRPKAKAAVRNFLDSRKREE